MVENYNNEKGIEEQRDELAISISEMEALLGIIRRDISHPYVTMPSEMDLMLLKEVYGTDISMCDMQKVNNLMFICTRGQQATNTFKGGNGR